MNKNHPFSTSQEKRLWDSMQLHVKYDAIRDLISSAVSVHFNRLHFLAHEESACPHEIQYINAQIRALNDLGDNLSLDDVDHVNAWLWPLAQSKRL